MENRSHLADPADSGPASGRLRGYQVIISQMFQKILSYNTAVERNLIIVFIHCSESHIHTKTSKDHMAPFSKTLNTFFMWLISIQENRSAKGLILVNKYTPAQVLCKHAKPQVRIHVISHLS